MNHYTINDLYHVDFSYDYLDAVINSTLEHEQVKNAYLSIIFVDEAEIQRLNKEYRHIDKVTDVISFALEDNEPNLNSSYRVLGDIYICIPRMFQQAEDYGHTPKRELAFLTVHGLLHLLGYDHQTPEDEEKMFSLQELILNAQNITR